MIRVKSLEIENMGCFAKEVFDLSHDLTFVTGDNGSGKSTILELLLFSLTGKASSPMRNLLKWGRASRVSKVFIFSAGC